MTNEPTKPILERMRGAVMPGNRGMEQHGVPVEGAPQVVDEWELGDPVETEPEKRDPDPIPVRVVSGDSPTETKDFRAAVVPVGAGQTGMILARDPKRTRATIVAWGPSGNEANDPRYVSVFPRQSFTNPTGTPEGPDVQIPVGSRIAEFIVRTYSINGGGSITGSLREIVPQLSNANVALINSGAISTNGTSRPAADTYAGSGVIRGRYTVTDPVTDMDVELLALIIPPASAPAVYLSDTPSPGPMNGYRLDAGRTIALSTTEPVYAFAADGAVFRMLVEHTR